MKKRKVVKNDESKMNNRKVKGNEMNKQEIKGGKHASYRLVRLLIILLMINI